MPRSIRGKRKTSPGPTVPVKRPNRKTTIRAYSGTMRIAEVMIANRPTKAKELTQTSGSQVGKVSCNAGTNIIFLQGQKVEGKPHLPFENPVSADRPHTAKRVNVGIWRGEGSVYSPHTARKRSPGRLEPSGRGCRRHKDRGRRGSSFVFRHNRQINEVI